MPVLRDNSRTRAARDLDAALRAGGLPDGLPRDPLQALLLRAASRALTAAAPRQTRIPDSGSRLFDLATIRSRAPRIAPCARVAAQSDAASARRRFVPYREPGDGYRAR